VEQLKDVEKEKMRKKRKEKRKGGMLIIITFFTHQQCKYNMYKEQPA